MNIYEIKRKNFNYFYRIDCSLNGCYYYGVHGTNNLYDSYMGSSRHLKIDMKLLGIENFCKYPLKFFDTFDEALNYEAFIVDKSLILDPSCYNKCLGGRGDWRYTKGTTPIIDNYGHCFRVNINDNRIKTG